MTNALLTYWPLIIFFLTTTISTIIWGLRLEGKVRYLERSDKDHHRELDKRVQSLGKRVDMNMREIKNLGDIRVTIAKIETTLENMKDQVDKLVTYFIESSKDVQ